MAEGAGGGTIGDRVGKEKFAELLKRAAEQSTEFAEGGVMPAPKPVSKPVDERPEPILGSAGLEWLRRRSRDS